MDHPVTIIMVPIDRSLQEQPNGIRMVAVGQVVLEIFRVEIFYIVRTGSITINGRSVISGLADGKTSGYIPMHTMDRGYQLSYGNHESQT